jgi:hypothetical protein
VVQKYDEDDDLYWVLYSDGDSEDMNEPDVRIAVLDHRAHMTQPVEAESKVETIAVGDSLLSAATDETTVPVTAVPAANVLVADTNSVQSSSISDVSEIAVAVRAMTAAAERLTSAASRIEAAVQQHQQQQQPQWHLHHSLHRIMLQQQQQQQQQAYYEQQHMLNWQLWQQWQR